MHSSKNIGIRRNLQSDGSPTGTLILVVGPSGCGKDSLIDAARSRFSESDRLVFARRCITRPADAGGERHEAVSCDEFIRRLEAGDFMLHWQAYGMHYGIPGHYYEAIRSGNSVVANVSRMVLNDARRRFGNVLVLNVTASPDRIAERIANRGREDAGSISKRLQRAVVTMPTGEDVIMIDNDGAFEDAAARFEAAITDTLNASPKHLPEHLQV
jgi:ribose 1,5-bisphosphokinase